MSMILPLFVEKICSHRGACLMCRRQDDAGDQWRTAMEQAFEMPAKWPRCPIGIPWNATAADVKAIAGGCVVQCDDNGAPWPPVEMVPTAVLLERGSIKTRDGTATLGDLVLMSGSAGDDYTATSADGKFFVELKRQAGDSGGGSHLLKIIDTASSEIAWKGCSSILQPTNTYTRLCGGDTCDANLGVTALVVS